MNSRILGEGGLQIEPVKNITNRLTRVKLDLEYWSDHMLKMRGETFRSIDE